MTWNSGERLHDILVRNLTITTWNTGKKLYMTWHTGAKTYMMCENCTWNTGEKPYMTRLVKNLTWHAINTWNSVQKLYMTYWWETLHAMLQLHGTLVRNLTWHTGEKPYMTHDNCTWNNGEINTLHDKTGEKPYMTCDNCIWDWWESMTCWWETLHGTCELYMRLVRNCTWHTGEKSYMTDLEINCTRPTGDKLHMTKWWETKHVIEKNRDRLKTGISGILKWVPDFFLGHLTYFS